MFDFRTIFTGEPAWTVDVGKLPAYEYTTFGRRFVSYRWFKPLLTVALAFVFWIVLGTIILFLAMAVSQDPNFIETLSGDYETMDTYSLAGGLANLGILAVILPALAFALIITGERPFSSLSSSCSGWRWSVFGKCLGVAAALYAIEIIIQISLFSEDVTVGTVLFDAAGLAACIALVPFQCIAEEYLFRGFLMQTFGSWFRFPVIALVLQAALFAAGHPYDFVGVAVIFVDGIAFGLMAMVSKGLEASSAFHIVNNMIAFLMIGFGLAAFSSTVSMIDAVSTVILDIAYIAIIIVADRKWNWFPSREDGTIKHNEKHLVFMMPDKVARAIGRGAILPPSYVAWQQQFLAQMAAQYPICDVFQDEVLPSNNWNVGGFQNQGFESVVFRR